MSTTYRQAPSVTDAHLKPEIWSSRNACSRVGSGLEEGSMKLGPSLSRRTVQHLSVPRVSERVSRAKSDRLHAGSSGARVRRGSQSAGLSRVELAARRQLRLGLVGVDTEASDFASLPTHLRSRSSAGGLVFCVTRDVPSKNGAAGGPRVTTSQVTRSRRQQRKP